MRMWVNEEHTTPDDAGSSIEETDLLIGDWDLVKTVFYAVPCEPFQWGYFETFVGLGKVLFQFHIT